MYSQRIYKRHRSQDTWLAGQAACSLIQPHSGVLLRATFRLPISWDDSILFSCLCNRELIKPLKKVWYFYWKIHSSKQTPNHKSAASSKKVRNQYPTLQSPYVLQSPYDFTKLIGTTTEYIAQLTVHQKQVGPAWLLYSVTVSWQLKNQPQLLTLAGNPNQDRNLAKLNVLHDGK